MLRKELNGFIISSFDCLSATELYEIMRARADVFTKEEKILYPDADGVDYDCVHVFTFDDAGHVSAYLRMFEKKDEPGVIQMGRVLTRHHGNGLGKKLLETSMVAAKEYLSADEIYLESQKHAQGFYEKEGYHAVSDEFIEAGIPHVQMRRKL